MKKANLEQIKQITRRTHDKIFKTPIRKDVSLAYWDKWFKEEQRWAELYEGASVRIIKSSANDFFIFSDHPKSYVGRCGKLRRVTFAGREVLFVPNFMAWQRGFSGVEVFIDFGNGEDAPALIEEVEFL